MVKYKDEKALMAVGKIIEQYRQAQEYNVEDVAEMTGFSAQTIRNIEAGEETSLSYFIATCQAIGYHPMKVFNIEIPIVPRFPLSAARKEKSRLTQRINSLIERDFFLTGRTAKEIVEELTVTHQVKTTTSKISVILKRKVDENSLKVEKKDNINFYKNQECNS